MFGPSLLIESTNFMITRRYHLAGKAYAHGISCTANFNTYNPWTNLLVVMFQAMHSKWDLALHVQQCQAHKTTEKLMNNWVVTYTYMHDFLCLNFKYLTAIASHLAHRYVATEWSCHDAMQLAWAWPECHCHGSTFWWISDYGQCNAVAKCCPIQREFHSLNHGTVTI